MLSATNTPCPDCGCVERVIEPATPGDPDSNARDIGELELCSDCGHEFSEGPREADRRADRIEVNLEASRGN